MINASTLSNNTLTVIIDGVIYNGTSDQPQWVQLVNAYSRGDEAAMKELFSMKRVVEKFSCGGLLVSDQGVFYKDMPLAGVDVDRVMAFMRQGLPYEPIAKYMGRKFLNPSRRAITEMYNFLEHRQMPLTPNGLITAYKGVRQDFFSGRSGSEPLLQGRRNEDGQIFNGVGETIEMERSFVDDDFRQDCSGGLHAGSLDYAKNYARSIGGIIILIEIDPADVVSVPSDCDCKKLRCCKYRVASVYDGPLPDTYTADYSGVDNDKTTVEGNEDAVCDNCGETECSCEDEICDECGENVDNCSCDFPQEEEKTTSAPVALGTPNVTDNMVVVTREQNAAKGKSESGSPLYDPSIRHRAVTLMCEQLGVDPKDVTDESSFIENLGADSLNLVEMVMAIEEEFDLEEISDEEANRCDTVGKMINALSIKLTAKTLFAPVAPAQIPTPKPETADESAARLWAPTSEEKAPEQDGPTMPETVVVPNSDVDYHEGYKLGLRNGTRRVKRLYHPGDENVSYTDSAEFIKGYNVGYRNARWDYKK